MRGTMMDFPLTLRHIFERGVALYPDQEIVTGGAHGVHRYTYREFGARVRRLAGVLTGMGVKPGDRVATCAWNTYRHLELYFAVPLIGGVLHTVNFRLFHEQIAYILNHGGARLLFADRSLLPLIQALRPSLTAVERVVLLDDGSEGDPGESLDYEAGLAGGAEAVAFPPLDEDDAAMMCYTSGTTGDPKGVAYSHRALVLHSFGECMADTLAVSQRETIMALVPMFHANAWGLPYASTWVGAKQVFPGVAPQPQNLLALIKQEGVTFAAGVPSIFIGLEPALTSGKVALDQLKTVVIGGSAAPRGLIEAYDKLGITILHAWGMTELTPLGTVSRLKAHLEGGDAGERLTYRAKQGLPAPGVELKAIDAEGNETPWDGATLGELVARGPWVAAAYYNDPRSAASFTEDGWFRTGDIVTVDAEGYIEIADRTKDLIKSGGEWISSVALEGALMTHPKVLEAAVIAIPDERWVERPLACVVLRPEAKGSATEAELTEYLAARFAKWWLPDRYAFLDELPKTSVGKLYKHMLRQRYAAGVLS
jgi:fatty-acyl-CoA synthase